MKTLRHNLLVLLLTLLAFKMEQASGEGRFRLKSNGDCGCPGRTLTFECTVMRGVGTIWRGSAFNCSNSSGSNNEIILFDGGHGNEPVTWCNGAIVGQVVEVHNGSYTSQLAVTVNSDVIGKSIECAFQNSFTEVGSYTIPSFPTTAPPNNLHISHIDIGLIQLTFAWSPVAPDCSGVYYNILASNCGSCPTTTNYTNVTCTNIPTAGSMCTFAVRTVVCGNITGSENSSISILVLNSLTSRSNNVTEWTSIDVIHFASIGFLAVSLVVSIVVITTIVIVVLIRLKRNTNVQQRERSWTDTYTDVIQIQRCRERRDSNVQKGEIMYEEVYDIIPDFATLSFKQNVAYGH